MTGGRAAVVVAWNLMVGVVPAVARDAVGDKDNDEVRGDDPELAGYLRIEERELEAERAELESFLMGDFHHGHEPRAEEIALHQKYLTLEGQIDAARLEGNEAEVRRLTPLVKRAKTRWIKANRRVTRGS